MAAASSSLKPITLYGHDSGPNPWKVAVLLEELGIPFKYEFPDMSKIKEEPYTLINPNGRVPAIEDPNTGITLWESGAIMQYLIETYDTTNQLSYATSPEKFQCYQWLAFQISGQGPYYGQAFWFLYRHPEKIVAAQERYVKEVERVISVLDGWLAKSKSGYLVGDKCTYADLSFLPWASLVAKIDPENKILDEGRYPAYQEWIGKLMARPKTKKVFDYKAELGAKARY